MLGKLCEGYDLSPYDIFLKISDFNNLLKKIVIPESVRYAHQEGRTYKLKDEEMKAFIGLNLLMTYHRLPALHLYWSTHSEFNIPFLANCMTRDQFMKIRRNMHFNSKEEELLRTDLHRNKACKVCSLLNRMNHAFSKPMIPEEYQSIDKRMIKFKGPNIMKQYLKQKSIKWGLKMWVRAGSMSGYVHEVDPYAGNKPNVEEGLGENVVFNLTKSLRQSNCCVTVQSIIFMSVNVAHTLHSNGIRGVDTIRPNRKHLPKDIKSDELMKKGNIKKRETNDQKLHYLK